MKLYIKLDENNLIIESCIDPIEWSTQITVTEKQAELIQKQYDTKVEDNKIVSQEKWENALLLEKNMEENK